MTPTRRHAPAALTGPGPAPGPAPRIDGPTCSRCGLCLAICPPGAIDVAWGEGGGWLPRIDEQRCTRCGDCERACPVQAVELPWEIVLETRAGGPGTHEGGRTADGGR